MKMIAFFILSFILAFPLGLSAQNREVIDSINRVSIASLDSIKLPPLSVFLESIYTHPSTQIYDTYREEEQAKLKVEKRKWMNYLKGVANYQYGQYNAFNESMSTDIPPSAFYNGQTRAYYNAGVVLSIPLGDVFSRKSNIQAQNARLKRVEYEYEIALEERKLTILEVYNKVVQLQTVLKAKADAAVLYNAQMKISEQDYINGKISIVDLSLERGRRSAAVVNYEEGKAQLQNAIILLETLTNIKIIK